MYIKNTTNDVRNLIKELDAKEDLLKATTSPWALTSAAFRDVVPISTARTVSIICVIYLRL